MIKLCNATVDQLPAAILRPSYDRSRLTPGIVHIGGESSKRNVDRIARSVEYVGALDTTISGSRR